MVAVRAKETVFYIFTALYMWYDLFQLIFFTSACDLAVFENIDPIRIKYYLAYKVVLVIPTLFFDSFVVVHLTYRALHNSISYIKRFSKNSRATLASACSSFLNIDVDDEAFYCQRDIDYVLNLLNRKPETESPTTALTTVVVENTENNDVRGGKLKTKKYVMNKTSHHSSAVKKQCSMFLHKLYKWQVNFKFSSRFVTSCVVALITLYHTFVFIIYEIIDFTLLIDNYLPDSSFAQQYISVDLGALPCFLGYDFCVNDLQNLTTFNILIPEHLRTATLQVKQALAPGLIVPVCVALVICLIQFLLGVKDFQNHLSKMYKGKCSYVSERRKLTNPSIAGWAFHFGGYLVGYLIWGYLLLAIVLILVSLTIILLYFFVGGKSFVSIILKIVPAVVAIILRTAITKVVSRTVFLNSKSKILAVDNFRAYTLFLYFNYFFDCFMGVVSAVSRILKSAIVGLLMMPRIRWVIQ
jgi:hypothetical protein